jgi:molybdate transport system substrate-binding protein
MDSSIRVLSTLALKGTMSRFSEAYQTESGTRIDADFAPTLALLDRIRRGEGADVVILTREGLDELVREGRVPADSCVDLARSYVGLAVKAGARRPDISTEAALREALLGASAVAYSQLGASGILFAQLIERLGIAAEINARAVIISQGFTAEKLVQQISELKQVAGIDVIGAIPHGLQTPAVFSAGRTASSKLTDQGNRLLRYLASPEVAPLLRESGLEP